MGAAVGAERTAIKSRLWSVHTDHSGWSVHQCNTLYRLQRSKLKGVRDGRLKEGPSTTYAAAKAQLRNAGRGGAAGMDFVGQAFPA
ncbi:MAG: hypothetical protein H7335_08725 [Massilia sp.]|nr:hypothetical protein [Massilia sp.]